MQLKCLLPRLLTMIFLQREKKSYEKDSNIFVDWVEGINKRDLKTAAQQEQFEATKTRVI